MHAKPLACLLVALCGGLAHVATAADRAVTMVLQWEHQAQFAGYYMALEKGFYAEEALNVVLQPGGADVHPLKLVLAGKADFCSSMLSSALTQSDPHQLTLLRQVINRCNLTMVAWKEGRAGDSGIETPADLSGKTVTVWEDFQTPYRQFFLHHRITPVIVPQYYSPSLFLARGADACCAMRYNEYHTIRQLGLPSAELTVLNLYEQGVDLPEDGIYCRRELYRESPEVCERFARASLRGWQYAKDHPQETLDVVMKHIHDAKIPTNRPHMRWMLQTVLESVFPGPEPQWAFGKLSKSSYQSALRLLQIEKSAPAFEELLAKEAANDQD